MSGTARAVIRPRICAGVSDTPVSSTTAVASRSLVSRSAYDFTRWVEKRPPWYASDAPVFGVVTKNVVDVAYRGGVRAVTTTAATTARSTTTTGSHQFLRTARR